MAAFHRRALQLPPFPFRFGLPQPATVRGPQPPAHGQIRSLITVRPKRPTPHRRDFFPGFARATGVGDDPDAWASPWRPTHVEAGRPPHKSRLSDALYMRSSVGTLLHGGLSTVGSDGVIKAYAFSYKYTYSLSSLLSHRYEHIHQQAR